MKFPDNFGTDLAGLTFCEVFEMHPKWIECVRETWTSNCTGLFLEFLQYVRLRLVDPISVDQHEDRCRKYVKKCKKSQKRFYNNFSKNQTTKLSNVYKNQTTKF